MDLHWVCFISLLSWSLGEVWIELGKIHILAWNKVKDFRKRFQTPLLEFFTSISPPPLRQQTKTLQIPPFLACFIHRVTQVLLRALQHTWTQEHKFVSGTQRSSEQLIVFHFRSAFRLLLSTQVFCQTASRIFNSFSSSSDLLGVLQRFCIWCPCNSTKFTPVISNKAGVTLCRMVKVSAALLLCIYWLG